MSNFFTNITPILTLKKNLLNHSHFDSEKHVFRDSDSNSESV